MLENIRKMVAQAEKVQALETEWLRHLLTISTGSLTLLVTLRPQGPVPAPEKYFLVTCWISLGAAILLGCGATFREIAIARNFRAVLHRKVSEDLERGFESGPELVSDSTSRLWKFCGAAMMGALAIAVTSLVIYAVLDTL